MVIHYLEAPREIPPFGLPKKELERNELFAFLFSWLNTREVYLASGYYEQ